MKWGFCVKQYLVTFKGFWQADERIPQIALGSILFLTTHSAWLVNQNRELGSINECSRVF